MSYFQMFTNYLNAVVGRNQEFDDLIKAKDISRVKSLFQSREEETAEAMMEYDTRTHEINKRQDKIVRNKLGQRKGIVKRWKLPLNYPQYINEISVVFIYGRPVKWTLQGDTGEKAFEAFKDVIKKHGSTARLGSVNALQELKRSLQCYSVCSATMMASPMCKSVYWHEARETRFMPVGTSTKILCHSHGAITLKRTAHQRHITSIYSLPK